MKFISPRGLLAALAVIGLSLSAQAAKGAFISSGLVSTEGLGSFTGSLNVSAVNANQATLTISLTNTSPALNGGYITAFVFNNPNDTTFTIAYGTSTLASFNTPLTDGDNAVTANPFGTFDFGVSTGGDFEGGGSPTGGVSVGNSATWTFSISGTGAGSLTDSDFIDALSNPKNRNKPSLFMAVRFKGFEDRGSDKVGAVTTNVVPAPAGLILLASAVPVFAMRRLVRRKQAA
jgi:hypothetical protein